VPGYLFIRNSIRHLQQMDVAARNVRLQLSGGAPPALRSRWYGDYEINPLSRASRRAKALGYPGRSPPARAISDYLFKDHVTVHPWGHPQPWERGRPARTASPRARCPGDIIGYLFTPGVIHKPGSAGVPPAPRLQEQDALAPGDIISPRARCPRSRRHGTRTPAAASPPGSML